MGQTFKDKIGDEWEITIDAGMCKTVRQRCDLDPYGLLSSLLDKDDHSLAEVLGDPIRCVDLIYVLCKEQADAKGVDDAHFGRRFTGEVWEAAADALVRELIFFCP